MNVTIRNDGTRIETERIATFGGAKVTTTITKPCGCRTTTSYETGNPRFGSSGHSSSSCSKHRIQMWNAIPDNVGPVLVLAGLTDTRVRP